MIHWIFVTFSVLASSAWAQKLTLPERGAVIGGYVEAGPVSEDVRPQEVAAFEKLIGKNLSWIYFANNWTDGVIEFPKLAVQRCRDMGRIPYIRLMPWSEYTDKGQRDPIFTMDAFLSGKFDSELTRWALEAKKLPGPMIIEFGPEVNGNWFPWNGSWNGGAKTDLYGDPTIPDGPEKFRDTYRHIIDLFRKEGLHDITWVLHVDTARMPETSWNKTEYYYPGDDYIDWIGLSVFGAQLPSHAWTDFLPKFKSFWPEIKDLAQRKPIIISEFAVIEDAKDPQRKAQWITRALKLVESGLYPIKGISYWNSTGWLPDAAADFRITSSANAQKAFQERVQGDFWKVLEFSNNQGVTP